MSYLRIKTLGLGLGVVLLLGLGLNFLLAAPGTTVWASMLGRPAADPLINLTIGTIAPHKTVTLTFDVTVGDLPFGTNELANQGEVSGSNLPTTRTDDPALPGATDPTTIAAQSAVMPRFAFSKTVGIANITPLCTDSGTRKVPVNTTVVYCYTIRNTGPVTFTTHTLVDNRLGTLLNGTAYELAPGAVFSHTANAVLTVNTTNVATWTAAIAAPVAAAAVSADPVTVATNTSATVLISAAADDQDGDTIPDNVEGAADPDQDNRPNFLDPDADADGIADQTEAGPDPTRPRDSNNDGIPDFLDPTRPTGLNPGDEPTAGQARIFLPLIQHNQ